MKKQLKTHFPTVGQNRPGQKAKRKLTYKDYEEGTRWTLNESQNEKGSYTINILGKKFIVLPKVFSPKYFNDTGPFSEHLPVKEGDEVLEIGPGTGVISIMAAYKGAKRVVAIDINPHAVENTKVNVIQHKMEGIIDMRLGDVYVPLRGGEKFDIIFWNTPFGLADENTKLSDLDRAVLDPGYKGTERFIKEAKDYLKGNGKIYIGFSSTMGRLNLLEKFVRDAGFTLRTIYEVESEEVYPVKFEIFEATPVW